MSRRTQGSVSGPTRGCVSPTRRDLSCQLRRPADRRGLSAATKPPGLARQTQAAAIRAVPFLGQDDAFDLMGQAAASWLVRHSSKSEATTCTGSNTASGADSLVARGVAEEAIHVVGRGGIWNESVWSAAASAAATGPPPPGPGHVVGAPVVGRDLDLAQIVRRRLVRHTWSSAGWN